jgi:hypothetical protein
MATVFFDCRGVLMVEFMQEGTTIMSEVCCKTQKTLGPFTTKAWSADIWCTHSTPPTQCASAYSCSHPNTAGAFQLGVWPPSLQPRSHSERLPPGTGWDHSTYAVKRSWWKVSKCGWAHRRQTSLTQTYKNLCLDMTGASIPAVTTVRSSLSMYIFFVYNTFFFLIAC